MKQLNYRQLRLISEISEQGQLSVAASVLGISQPAASRMLSDIEERIGVKLCARHAKGMEMTQIGQVMASRAQTILHEIGNLNREINELVGGTGGIVRVGAVSGAAVGYLVPAIQRLKKSAPLVEVHVDVASSSALLQNLRAGAYDFILGRVSETEGKLDFDIYPALSETVDLIVRQDHPLLAKGAASLADLSGYEWVIQSKGTPIRAAVELACLECNAPLPQKTTNTSSLIVMLAMLANSDVIAPVSSEVKDMLTEKGIRAQIGVVELLEKIVVSPYNLLAPRDRQLSPVAQRLKDMVVNEVDGNDINHAV